MKKRTSNPLEPSGGKRVSEPQLIGNMGSEIAEEFKKMAEQVSERIKQDKIEFYSLIGPKPEMMECAVHEGQTCLFDEEATLASWRRTGGTRLIFFPCPKCTEEALVDERNYKWRKLGIPKKVQTATFDNFETSEPKQVQVLAKVRKQAERRRGFILLIGNNGNGKSHLAAATLKLCGGGVFVIEDDLIADLRKTYDEGGKEKMLTKYKEAKCLVVDEIDAQLKGDDINPLLYNILAYRYDRDLITVLTTNEELDKLKEILGARLNDRIAADYTVANFTWDSYRRKNAVKSNPTGGT